MGLTKRLLEEQLERGWWSVGKYICADCLTSAPLKGAGVSMSPRARVEGRLEL